MSTRCKFCDNFFSSLSNLYTHQKQAKFCLEKRGMTPKKYICNRGKEFVQKRYLINREKCPQLKIKY